MVGYYTKLWILYTTIPIPLLESIELTGVNFYQFARAILVSSHTTPRINVNFFLYGESH